MRTLVATVVQTSSGALDCIEIGLYTRERGAVRTEDLHDPARMEGLAEAMDRQSQKGRRKS